MSTQNQQFKNTDNEKSEVPHLFNSNHRYHQQDNANVLQSSNNRVNQDTSSSSEEIDFTGQGSEKGYVQSFDFYYKGEIIKIKIEDTLI